jgi:hypothetical protein
MGKSHLGAVKCNTSARYALKVWENHKLATESQTKVWGISKKLGELLKSDRKSYKNEF